MSTSRGKEKSSIRGIRIKSKMQHGEISVQVKEGFHAF